MSEVRIAIMTAPSEGISLASEIRLLKPALLYADHVTLYSPAATLLQSTAAVGLSTDATLELMRQVAPQLDPNVTRSLEVYDQLRAKKHKTRSEIQTMLGFRR